MQRAMDRGKVLARQPQRLRRLPELRTESFQNHESLIPYPPMVVNLLSHLTREKLDMVSRTTLVIGRESARRATEEDGYSADILQRLAAARGALNRLIGSCWGWHSQPYPEEDQVLGGCRGRYRGNRAGVPEGKGALAPEQSRHVLDDVHTIHASMSNGEAPVKMRAGDPAGGADLPNFSVHGNILPGLHCDFREVRIKGVDAVAVIDHHGVSGIIQFLRQCHFPRLGRKHRSACRGGKIHPSMRRAGLPI